MPGLRSLLLASLFALGVVPSGVRAQAGESDLRVFGYLQASFYQETYAEGSPGTDANTFTVQQLDIMLQKDLGRRWSSFVDLLLTNNYSSFQNTGTFELQQAWVRYRRSHYLNIKAGLLIPKFNYLNEIKNKMPVLPYIIRPIVYETSFQEDIFLEEYIPQRAYLQVYGYAPVGDYKIDYAGYLGNSPNVNRNSAAGQTGLDSTNTFLTGGRIGVRHTIFEAGVSVSHDKVDYLDGVQPDTLSPAISVSGVTRFRLGVDLAVEYKRFRLNGEYISVRFDEDIPDIKNDKMFYYATLGYQFTDRLFAFGSYWYIEQYLSARSATETFSGKWHMNIPNGGVAYQMTDRVTLKGAIAHGEDELNYSEFTEQSFNFYALAVSVMF